MQSGVIALSKDGGETWKTAIKPDGIVAERLIGQIIAGQNLMITNSAGTFTLDNTGAVFDVNSFIVRSSSGGNAVENWQSASDFVSNYTDGNIITIYEKGVIKTEWDRIANEYTAKSSTIDLYYGVDKSTLQFVIDYDNAYNSLYNYLFVENQTSGVPLMANMSEDTVVDAIVYKAKFSDYYSTRDEVDRQFSLKTKSRIDEVEDDVVYKTELHSTNGDLFSNGNINTTLYVKVYRGKDDITATLPNSAFIWRKTDESGVPDTAWNNAHNGVGSSISVTKDDVNKKAVFWCDIDIP
jgi:hypothetical protein